MRKVCALLLLVITVACTQPADAQISVNIGINLPVFPNLVVVPGYPVYYAPSVTADYFFYDGFYWVFNIEDGQWYSSSWYNGPWVFVEPIYVPQPILVIPIRYYRVRPAYWGGWAYEAPPRWGQHWGRDWESRRGGWDRWDRSRAQAAAPLPLYQREYPRDRYPAPSQQVIIHNERYKYQAHDAVVQQQGASIFRQQSSGGMKATARAERVDHQGSAARERPQRQESAPPPPARSPRQETTQPPAAPRNEAPAVERSQPERGRRPEPQRVEPQPNAPREQVAPQQAPRGERAPAHPPAQPPSVQPQPPQQHPREERQQPEQRQQPERGPEGRPQEGQGQGHK